MDADEKRNTSRCNNLHELPPVFTDWMKFSKP
jgi:hypothetical protein